METLFIYTLSCPITNTVKYIGKTFDIDDRYNRHISAYYLSDNTIKSNWIISLIRGGLYPVIEVLDEGNTDNINNLEKYWISQFKNWGFELKNGTGGGDGYDWTGRKHTEESVLKMKINHPLRRCAGKFDLDNNLVERFISLHEASELSNLSRRSISDYCNSEKIIKGFIWKYIDDFSDEIYNFDKPKYTNLELIKEINTLKSKTPSPRPIKIVQYDLLGNILGKFYSPAECNRLTKIHVTLITRCCEDKTIYTCKLHDGTNNRCTFRYDDDIFEFIQTVRNSKVSSPEPEGKVYKYDIDNNLIETYQSFTDAYKTNNIRKTSMLKILDNPFNIDNKRKILFGYNYRI